MYGTIWTKSGTALFESGQIVLNLDTCQHRIKDLQINGDDMGTGARGDSCVR
jgi:hypothetical protein